MDTVTEQSCCPFSFMFWSFASYFISHGSESEQRSKNIVTEKRGYFLCPHELNMDIRVSWTCYLIIVRCADHDFCSPPFIASISRKTPHGITDVVRRRVFDVDVEVAHNPSIHVIVENHAGWSTTVTRHHWRDHTSNMALLTVGCFYEHIVPYQMYKQIGEGIARHLIYPTSILYTEVLNG